MVREADDDGDVDDLDRLVRRTTLAMRLLPRCERDRFVVRILESDPDLCGVLPMLLAIYAGAKLTRVPLRRDGVA
jgi:hypothetical protein